jgi:uncharacterized protein (TIGR00251 family)
MSSGGLPSWVRDGPAGATLRVHARPGASRSGIGGLHGEAIAVRVRARPVEGAANREVLAVLAAALGVSPSALALEAGGGGRQKRVRVEGLDAATVAARLAMYLVP